jgi:hypothetical protein
MAAIALYADLPQMLKALFNFRSENQRRSINGVSSKDASQTTLQTTSMLSSTGDKLK